MLLKPENPTIATPLEKTSCSLPEQEQHLNNILNSPSPFKLLPKIIQAHIPQRTDYETYVNLHNQIQTDPSNPNPKLELLWLCLPTILTATQNLRGLGINDPDLISQGLEITQEVISQWTPPTDQPQQQDYLIFQVNSQINRQIKNTIAGHFGLSNYFFPTVKLYLDTIKEFETEHHRPTTPSDFSAIKKIISEKIKADPKPNQYLLNLEGGNSFSKNLWWGDVITQIHDIHTQKTIISDHDSSDTDSSLNREQLHQQLVNLAQSLTPEEKTVLEYRFADDFTFEKIASLLGVTISDIRQLEAKALRKLRQPGKSHTIRDFLD